MRRYIKKIQYRSGLEEIIGKTLTNASMTWTHESETLKYLVPSSEHRYLPDFQISTMPNIILEAKGIFSAADRKKMILVQEQHPTRIVIMVFGRASNKLRKGSKTSYADWCNKNNIAWCDLADFVKDPKECLLSSIKRRKSGDSKTSLQKKSQVSSKRERKVLSPASVVATLKKPSNSSSRISQEKTVGNRKKKGSPIDYAHDHSRHASKTGSKGKSSRMGRKVRS